MHESRWSGAPSKVVLVEKDGRFVVYQPGLALVASGNSIEDAYGKFAEAKLTFFREIERAGIGMDTAAPRRQEGTARVVASRGVFAELGMFVAKTCIVMLLVAGICGVMAIAVKQSIGRLTASLPSEIGRATGGVSEFFKSLGSISMVDIANKAAVIAQDVQAMPEERKEALRQSVGILSRELAPIAEVWRNPPPPPVQRTTPELKQ